MTIASTIRMALAAPFCLLMLSACVADGPASPLPGGTAPVGMCDVARAQALVGGPRVPDDEARARTGAAQVRQIGPGDPVTMDFQENRVTVTTDPASGIVREARCG